MILRALALIAAAGLVSGCARRPGGWVVYTPPRPPTPAEVAADLSRVRGLPLDVPLDIQFVDDDAFLRAFHATQTPKHAHPTAYFRAFAMTRTDVAAMADRMLDSDLTGFYDTHTKRLYVRRGGNDPTTATRQRYTLAHEAEHALQDRFFGISAFSTFDDLDQALAWRALTEGDAMLASSVVESSRQGSAPAESIALIERFAQRHETASPKSPPRASAVGVPPALLEAQLAWPYTRGLAFIAELAASGGWTLVNAALRNPPKTTEQVLHTEKYLRGEGAIEVQLPKPADGYTYVEHGRMGELQTRFLLAECVTDREAEEAAGGWGGDAYTVIARGQELALLWSTAWDDEPAATRFADALQARSTCSRTGAKPAFTVVRDGARVAFVQGLSTNAERMTEANVLLTLVGRTPPALPPLGPVQLRPISSILGYLVVPTSAAADGFHAVMELDANLKNLTPTSDEATGRFTAVGQNVTVGAWLAWAPPSDAMNDTLTAMLVERMRKQYGAGEVLDGGTRRVDLTWTSAEERALRIGGRVEARLALAPTCDGQMTIALLTMWKSGTTGADTAAVWRASVRARATDGSCSALKSLRDPAKP